MPVPAAKVKALCTSSEADLVRNSRPPQIKALSLAQVKQAKARARKLSDKWQGQLHKQVRQQNRVKGVAAADSNTQLKAEIFREALAAFEARQADLEAKGAKPAAKKSKTPSKKSRAVGHRSTRAAIRNELALVGEVLNRGAKAVKNTVLHAAASLSQRSAEPAKKKAPAKKAAATKPKAEAVSSKPVKKSATTKKKITKQVPPAVAGVSKPSKGKGARVTAKAKQARLAESGKTSRVIGHTSARGKRSQARRDASGKKS